MIAGADGQASDEVNLEHLLTAHLTALLVFERRHDPAGRHVDDFAGRGIGVATVDTEGHPARIVAQLDAAELFGRLDGDVEVMHVLVVAVDDPDFLFIRREADAVAGAGVALDRPHREALHFHAMQHFTGDEIASFKPEQAIHVYVAQRARAVDGEGADARAERTRRLNDFARFGVHHAQQRGPQAGEVGVLAAGIDYRVVGARARRLDAADEVAGFRIDDIPEILFERRQIDFPPVRSDGHAIAATLERLLPTHLFGDEVDAGERVGGADKKPPRPGVGTDAFYVSGYALFIKASEGEPPEELVALVDVENEHAVAAVFEIVADPGRGDVEQPLLFVRRLEPGGTERADEEEQVFQEGSNGGCHDFG